MCPIAFSTIRGRNFSYFFSPIVQQQRGRSPWTGCFHPPQVHVAGQHGQHLSECRPAGGGRQRRDALQAGLPAGERGGGAEFSGLTAAGFVSVWTPPPVENRDTFIKSPSNYLPGGVCCEGEALSVLVRYLFYTCHPQPEVMVFHCCWIKHQSVSSRSIVSVLFLGGWGVLRSLALRWQRLQRVFPNFVTPASFVWSPWSVEINHLLRFYPPSSQGNLLFGEVKCASGADHWRSTCSPVLIILSRVQHPHLQLGLKGLILKDTLKSLFFIPNSHLLSFINNPWSKNNRTLFANSPAEMLDCGVTGNLMWHHKEV